MILFQGNIYKENNVSEDFISFADLEGEVFFSKQSFQNISVFGGSILSLRNIKNISILENLFETNFGYKGSCIYYYSEGELIIW